MKPMKFGIGVVLLTAGFAAGCVSSSSDVVKPLSAELAKTGHVTVIDVKSVPTNVSPQFKDLLAKHLQEQLSGCAKGTQALRLEASVVQFEEQDPGMTLLAGSADKIRGSVQLVDPVTNQVVGDYDISRSVGAGGLLGMAVLSGAEDKMAQAFAEEVCSRAFTTG